MDSNILTSECTCSSGKHRVVWCGMQQNRSSDVGSASDSL
jgi:hypothetical protein